MKAIHLSFWTILVSCLFSGVSFAQRSPGGLADISLSELLEVSVDAPRSSSILSETEGDPGGKSAPEAIEALSSGSPASLWYRYKAVEFEGYLDGTTERSNAEVLALYPVLPTVITQEAHIVGLNYRFSNLLDFNLTVPYIFQSTEHIRRRGAPFTLRSEGVGDVAFAANYALYKHGQSAAILTMGITAPTGSINAKGDTPRGRNTQLPYAMQIGSGTWEWHPGLTLTAPLGNWQVGTTLDGAIRLGENDRNYSLGDEFSATVWANRDIGSRLEFGSYVRGECWGGIDGQDLDVNPLIAPVADPNTYGGCSIEVGASLRVKWKEDLYDNCYFELGGGLPVYQNLKGPQPKEKWNLSLGVSIGF